MKKYILLLLGLFFFIPSVAADTITTQDNTIIVKLDGYNLPNEYWGVSANADRALNLQLYNLYDTSYTYLVMEVCTYGLVDGFYITNATKNLNWFNESVKTLYTENRCSVGSMSGRYQYVQIPVGRYYDTQGDGYYVSSTLHLKNIQTYYNEYHFTNVFLSTDDYLGPLITQAQTTNAIGQTNAKLDEAQETRKGILATVQSIVSGITNLPSYIWNAIKGGFEAITGAVTNLFNFFNDDEVDSSEGDSFFSSFEDTDHGGISGVITAPLKVVNKLTGTCSPINMDVLGKTVSLPCGDTLFWNKPEVSAFRTTWNVIFGGGILYALLLKLFKVIENLKNPDDSRIEVMKL